MKTIDGILALLCGAVVGSVISELLQGSRIDLGIHYDVILWLALAVISFISLWLAYLAGRKIPFVFQAAKFFLVGAFATVFDLKLFEFLAWFFGLFLVVNPLVLKGVSFFISTFLKYWANKYWTFQKHGAEDIYQQITIFFIADMIGVFINVTAFYYFTNMLGPQFSMPEAAWVKLSVIFAGLVAAGWNFLGYKFLVFKK